MLDLGGGWGGRGSNAQRSWHGRSAAREERAESLGASGWLTLVRVRLPAAAQQIAASLRTGLGLAWTSVIAAELVGAQSGLGYRIQMHRLMLETDGVIVGMLCIGILGFMMSSAAAWLERRLIPWL